MKATIVAIACAAAALTAPAAHAAVEFDRQCTGDVDAACYHDFCGFVDCVRSDCVVYVGVFGDGNSAVCAGKARPRGATQ